MSDRFNFSSKKNGPSVRSAGGCHSTIVIIVVLSRCLVRTRKRSLRQQHDRCRTGSASQKRATVQQLFLDRRLIIWHWFDLHCRVQRMEEITCYPSNPDWFHSIHLPSRNINFILDAEDFLEYTAPDDCNPSRTNTEHRAQSSAHEGRQSMFRRSTVMMVCAIIAAVLCGSEAANSMIIVTPREGQLFPRHAVELIEQKIDVRLSDRAAEVSVECIYHNTTNVDLEGEWIFPLPAEAAVDRFSMFVGGEEIRAELLDAIEARHIYETIVRRTQDPALLEYVDRQLLRARVYPIQAGKDAAIKLYYTHPLPADFGVTDFVFPIVEEQWSRDVWNNPQARAKSSIEITINTVCIIANT